MIWLGRQQCDLLYAKHMCTAELAQLVGQTALASHLPGDGKAGRWVYSSVLWQCTRDPNLFDGGAAPAIGFAPFIMGPGQGNPRDDVGVALLTREAAFDLG